MLDDLAEGENGNGFLSQESKMARLVSALRKHQLPTIGSSLLSVTDSRTVPEKKGTINMRKLSRMNITAA